jgi:hypothetical protein
MELSLGVSTFFPFIFNLDPFFNSILLDEGISKCPEVMEFCDRLVNQDPPCQSPYLYNFLLDSIVERLENGETENPAVDIAKANQVATEEESMYRKEVIFSTWISSRKLTLYVVTTGNTEEHTFRIWLLLGLKSEARHLSSVIYTRNAEKFHILARTI